MKTNLKSSKLTNIRQKLRILLRPFIVTVSLAIVAIIMPAVQAAVDKSSTADNYKQRLVSQVQTSSGVPKLGFNPAVQAQTSLASVASKPNSGIGERVDHPAAKLIGTQRLVNPADVLPDIKKDGISVSGCLIGYGTPGTQCLPAKATNDQQLTCAFARTMFPKGIAITGTDRLSLNTGGNVACGS